MFCALSPWHLRSENPFCGEYSVSMLAQRKCFGDKTRTVYMNKFIIITYLSVNWNKGPSGNISLAKEHSVYSVSASAIQCESLLSVLLFCFVVWPLAYILAGGLYTEAEKTAVISPLGAGTLFPLTTAKSLKKGGKHNVPDDAMTFTTSGLKKENSGKSQEITTGTVILEVWWLTS